MCPEERNLLCVCMYIVLITHSRLLTQTHAHTHKHKDTTLLAERFTYINRVMRWEARAL